MNNCSPCAIKTKNKMAKALKSIMQTKSFEKITISDITKECDFHRQTFYYHFQDKYELLDWLIYNELLVPFVNGLSFGNMFEKFRYLLEMIIREKEFYSNAIRIVNSEVSNYLSIASRELFSEVICSISKEKNIRLRDEVPNLIMVEFFGYGLSGIVLSWVQRGMKESPEVMTEKFKELVNACRLAFEQTG